MFFLVHDSAMTGGELYTYRPRYLGFFACSWSWWEPQTVVAGLMATWRCCENMTINNGQQNLRTVPDI
jgi:hypothetical protein